MTNSCDREAYLDAINRLKELGDIGDKCRAVAKKRFDLETVGGVRYRRLYEKLLQSDWSVANISSLIMHVLAVVPSVYDTSPGQRFRIEQWEPMLRENGVEITYAPFETDELRAILYSGGKIFEKIGGVTRSLKRRIDELSQLSKFDLVYVFREAALLGPPWFERKIGRSGVPMVFDFDDAIFFSYKSPSNGYLSYLKFPGKTAEICRLSTHVMAGNEFLADYARSSNNNVTIIPTTIDTDKYEFVERTDNPEIVTIGWSGSFSTVQHLDTIRDVLQELAKTEQFRLSVIGTPTYKLAGVDAEAIQWRSITEIEDLKHRHRPDAAA